MSAGNISWVFDETRRDYCYWLESEGCWLYYGGGRVYPPQGTNVDPVYTANNYTAHTQYPSQSAVTQWNNLAPQVGYTTPIAGNAYATLNPHNARPINTITPAQSEGPNVPYPYQYASAVVTPPSGTTIASGTPRDSECLRPDYEVQSSPNKFFECGKVFKALWPEMAGSGTGYSTNITAYGEGIFIKVRWFVVIKATNGSCTCLPIQTYSGRGVSKNVVKHHHAIIYTGNREPKPRHDEQPTSPRERGMLDSIRVIPTRQGESMDPMSRINFKKVYTVEYNVKVRDFGNVDKAFLRYLKRQFDQVWNED